MVVSSYFRVNQLVKAGLYTMFLFLSSGIQGTLPSFMVVFSVLYHPLWCFCSAKVARLTEKQEVPLWFIHAENDNVCPFADMEDLVQRLMLDVEVTPG